MEFLGVILQVRDSQLALVYSVKATSMSLKVGNHEQSGQSQYAADEATGKAKDVVGDVTDNDKLRTEGKTDQVKANLQQAGEKVKDAFKR